MSNKVQFIIEGEEFKKLTEFKKQHKKCFEKFHDVAGAQYEYCFIPTTLGSVITVECSCGEVLDLSDFLK